MSSIRIQKTNFSQKFMFLSLWSEMALFVENVTVSRDWHSDMSLDNIPVRMLHFMMFKIILKIQLLMAGSS